MPTMMLAKLFPLKQALLVAALAIALVAVGFSHTAPSSDDAALQSFVLSGGDLADLCRDANGDGLPDHQGCPACHIVATSDVPNVDLTFKAADLAFVSKVVAPRESRALRMVLDPARGMRAPPLA